MKIANRIVGLAVLVLMMAQLAAAQQQQPLSIGENTKLDSSAKTTFGYAGSYGDETPSTHGLSFGFDGTASGYYYDPNFIRFTVNPYYDQSRADSQSQSITGASGINGSANFFTGSHYPGAVTYSYTDNSSNMFGLSGQPNFTTVGKSRGLGINWSALLPNWPTLTVGFAQGNSSSNVFGTDQESNSTSRMINLISSYQIAGFRLGGFFDHNSNSSELPEFISGEQAPVDRTSGHNFGFGTGHSLPEHGSFSFNYNRATQTSDYLADQGQTAQGQDESTSNRNSYTYSNETAIALFHPTNKLSWNLSQSYADNLAGSVVQNLSTGTIPQGISFGPGSYSSTLGGGVGYTFTNYLSGSAQATYYSQHYFGQTYSGEFMSGTLSCSKRLWDMFSFSASVIDGSSDLGNNEVGFMGNVNFARRFGAWSTSASLSYSQNVQTMLVTYTTSSYGYGASVGRRLPGGLQWAATFGGGHSGLEQVPGNSNHTENFSTSLSMRPLGLAATSFYEQSTGISLMGPGGLVSVAPIPGLTDEILYSGESYGGGLSATPLKRMSIGGTFSRSISNTIAATNSHNDTQVFSAQMQYHLRRIGLQAGYLRFSQGISAIGPPVSSTSFFVGFTRWFNFF